MLVDCSPDLSLKNYNAMLKALDGHENATISSIYLNARTSIRSSDNFQRILNVINSMSWYASDFEVVGEIYEGLLEKIATDRKSGAGQYFTPRPLIDCIITVMRPKEGEIIQDPAAGTGGFLVAASRAINGQSSPIKNRAKIVGCEIVPETFRLLLMNFLLHDMDVSGLISGDAMAEAGAALPRSDVILSNPPFGVSKRGRKPERANLTLTGASRNKQLAFIEHIGRGLSPNGRAAVIVPDNVLFAGGVARQVRTWLLDNFVLHTILRLPSGIFYAQGIRTSVLFFNYIPGSSTSATWFYDLRAGLPAFGRSRPLRYEDFSDFISKFGELPDGSIRPPEAEPELSRFRRFSRDDLACRDDTLDVVWLTEPDASEDILEDVNDLLEAVREHLQRASAAVEVLAARTDNDISVQ
ncbi:SAM-dependent methyltransferase [Methylobacterium sp. 17Sr1-1]|nr:SAM-dependent methyltransferase [Methylobacterium sp. 17Sr1-1]